MVFRPGSAKGQAEKVKMCPRSDESFLRLSPIGLHSSGPPKHEFEADAYAALQASAGDLVRSLVKMYEDNAATLTPDPLHSAFYDSHPPAAVRIARLQAAG
jgi:hypothetical protein